MKRNTHHSSFTTHHSSLVPRLRFPEFRDAGPWEVKQLGEICAIKNGSSNAQDHTENGIYPLFDRSEVIKKSNRYLYDCEAVIIPGEGATFTPRYYRGKFDLHQRAYALMDFRANARFVGYQIEAFKNLLISQAVSSTVLSLRMPILERFTVLLPTGAEQQKIADCLSSLDELIELEAKKLEALKAYKKGLMQQLFPREGETTPRLRFPEFRNAGPWEVKRLGVVLTFQTGFPFSSKFFNEVGRGVRLVRNTDLKSDERTVFYSGPYDQAYVVNNGDVLVGMDGDFSPSVWRSGPALLNQRVGRIVAKQGNSLSFLHYSLQPALKLIENRTAQTTVKHLSHSAVEQTQWPIPTFPEQQKIADCLSSLDELIQLQAKKLDALKAHKKGLMQQLFPQEVG